MPAAFPLHLLEPFMAPRHVKAYRIVPQGRRLRVERLEDRRVLAVVTVNTLLDNLDFGDGYQSLRDALLATNALTGAGD